MERAAEFVLSAQCGQVAQCAAQVYQDWQVNQIKLNPVQIQILKRFDRFWR